MQNALVIVDAQNEFSAEGQRPVPNHPQALERIRLRVEEARQQGIPIAWVKHYNRPHESRAFVPGTWGAELSPGLGPAEGRAAERLFEKDVFGAFTGTDLEHWLREQGVNRIVLGGFYAHMCVSTTTREALVRDFDVQVDSLATGACALQHAKLGELSADEVRRTALMHLSHMGAEIL